MLILIDESQVVRATKGDKTAFVTLIKSVELTLYRVSKGILPSDHDCADAIQETITKAYSSLPALRKPKHFKTWIIRILINECKKMLNEKRKYVLDDDMTNIPQKIKPANDIKELVNILPNDLRLPLILFYIEDLPVKKIASLMGIPEGTVKSRLFRARKILLESKKEEDFN